MHAVLLSNLFTCALGLRVIDPNSNPRNDDVRLDKSISDTRNPAGCFPLSLGMLDQKGNYPVEGLREILEKGNKLKENANSCRNLALNDNWCPKPRTDALLSEADMQWYGELKQYISKALENADTSLPTVAAVWDKPISANAQSAQVENFICAFERLDMLNRTVIFATSQGTYDSLRKHMPHVTFFFHPHMLRLINSLSLRTNLLYANRLWKLVAAQLLLDVGRDALISDTDIFWLRDSSLTLHKSHVDFAAMHDCCQHDINSGFVYYRNTFKTRDLLHMTLSTWREKDICADNDQYLLNCGWMRAAVKGLNYGVLPEKGWTKSLIRRGCSISPPAMKEFAPEWIGDGLPYAYHTYGMTTNYMVQLDMLAAFDLYDVDSSTGQCKKVAPALDEILRKVNLSCVAGKDGITHAGCQCHTGETKRANDIIADMKKRLYKRTEFP